MNKRRIELAVVYGSEWGNVCVDWGPTNAHTGGLSTEIPWPAHTRHPTTPTRNTLALQSAPLQSTQSYPHSHSITQARKALAKSSHFRVWRRASPLLSYCCFSTEDRGRLYYLQFQSSGPAPDREDSSFTRRRAVISSFELS